MCNSNTLNIVSHNSMESYYVLYKYEYYLWWTTLCTIPDDEAHRLILCRRYDIKLQRTGDFGAKCTKFIPFAWKYPQAIVRASCRKAGCAFLLQREFSPLAVRFWEPIASLDRQNRSNFRRKISARETYSPPPFIIDVPAEEPARWQGVAARQIAVSQQSTTASS